MVSRLLQPEIPVIHLNPIDWRKIINTRRLAGSEWHGNRLRVAGKRPLGSLSLGRWAHWVMSAQQNGVSLLSRPKLD